MWVGRPLSAPGTGKGKLQKGGKGGLPAGEPAKRDHRMGPWEERQEGPWVEGRIVLKALVKRRVGKMVTTCGWVEAGKKPPQGRRFGRRKREEKRS